MRLINTSTLQLVSKLESEVPPYAILSHTWGGDDEEVTYQEMQRVTTSRVRHPNGPFAHPITKKVGFAKIRGSATLAESQGYEYIWIDTCCIDKTSSAELSEAINSMFRWYRDAAICYTFLNDVHDDESEPESSIRQSRWFARGWTLQELIAPSNVYFYSRNWKLLGTKLGDLEGLLAPKTDFPKLVSEITGIDPSVLNGNLVLDELSIANKMKWAANRQTTRIEDTAYCLMGIFNVHMPLLYGEGPRAFMRLQEEILKVTDDQSIFAWVCPDDGDMVRYQLSGLLAPSPAYFEHVTDMRPVPPNLSRASAPSTMTNVGLHVQLYLWSAISGLPADSTHDTGTDVDVSNDEHYAILNCYERKKDGVYYNPAILLVSLDGDQHARLRMQKLFWFRSTTRKTPIPGGKDRYVYVEQFSAYGLPDIVVSGDGSSGYPGARSQVLVEVHPRRGWSPKAQTFKARTCTPQGVLGVFRYVNVSKIHKTSFTDVYVGISSGYRGPLDCWCYQRSAKHEKGNRTMRTPPFVDIDGELQGLHLSGRHARQGIVATVETVRLRNKIFISLDVSELHEVNGDYGFEDTSPDPQTDTEIYELDGTQGASAVEQLTAIAAFPVTKDTWQSSVGLLDSAEVHAIPPRIRTTPANVDVKAGDFGFQAFDQMVARAARSDFSVDNPGSKETKMFEDYFSFLLVRACIKSNIPAATELLESPLSTALVEARTSLSADGFESWHELFKGFRPLHWACALGHTDIFLLLCRHGADVSSITSCGLSSVHLAALSGSLRILDYLLDTPVYFEPERLDAHYRAESPMHFVASYNRTDKVKAVLARLTSKRKPLVSAKDSYSAFENEPSNRSSGGTASNGEGYEMPINRLRETPLHRAAAMNNIYAAEGLLDKAGATLLSSQTSFGQSPLWYAAAAGAIDIVRIFLKHGANLHTVDKLGRSPLHAACRVGHEDVVEELIRAGANLQAVTSDPEFTAHHFAALSGKSNVLKILQKYDPSLDRQVLVNGSRISLAPLHITAANGFLDCTKVLVQAGCRTDTTSEYRIIVNSPTLQGVLITRVTSRTPGELAALGNHAEVAHLLQLSGKNINISSGNLFKREDSSSSPLDILLSSIKNWQT